MAAAAFGIWGGLPLLAPGRAWADAPLSEFLSGLDAPSSETRDQSERRLREAGAAGEAAFEAWLAAREVSPEVQERATRLRRAWKAQRETGGLIAELRWGERPEAGPGKVLLLEVYNAGTGPVVFALPADGSDFQMRMPAVEFLAEVPGENGEWRDFPLDRPLGRCGMMNPLTEKDFAILEPGEAVTVWAWLPWMPSPPPRPHRLRLRYQYALFEGRPQTGPATAEALALAEKAARVELETQPLLVQP